MSGDAVRLKLIIAYDGTPFLGWQSQSGGNTVQDHLEAAFAKLCGERVPVHGAGRTDAGVHALAQCAHADVKRAFSDWPRALNAHLPREIRVLRCLPVEQTFHARFSTIGKTYTYRIWNNAVHSPFELERSWLVTGELDLDVLHAGASRLTGTHDFASFAANRGKPAASTVRTVTGITVRRKGSLLTLTFVGDGFLYKMVRLMTGSLIRCAQKRAELDWLRELLDHKTKTSFAAPAAGLYLTKVHYQR